MNRTRSLSAFASAATLAITAMTVSAEASTARDAEALTALRALIENPAGPVAPVLSEYSFSDSQFLVDGLSRNEQVALRDLIYDFALRLPSGIDTALRAKNPRNINNGD